jgi:hypothetical protein
MDDITVKIILLFVLCIVCIIMTILGFQGLSKYCKRQNEITTRHERHLLEKGKWIHINKVNRLLNREITLFQHQSSIKDLGYVKGLEYALKIINSPDLDKPLTGDNK